MAVKTYIMKNSDKIIRLVSNEMFGDKDAWQDIREGSQMEAFNEARKWAAFGYILALRLRLNTEKSNLEALERNIEIMEEFME